MSGCGTRFTANAKSLSLRSRSEACPRCCLQLQGSRCALLRFIRRPNTAQSWIQAGQALCLVRVPLETARTGDATSNKV